MSEQHGSWSGFPEPTHHSVSAPHWQAELNWPAGSRTLAYGNGRSYGDVCQNPGGNLTLMRGLSRLRFFDREKGLICAEAGVTLGELLAVTEPAGWFLPVTPGTQFVTLGGAVANDVHGKNHHLRGSFGHHVQSFNLLRSDGRTLACSRESNAEYFRASIGGLGLTGIITDVTVQLMRVPGPAIKTETLRMANLHEFFELNRASSDFEYTVSWIDCTARGKQMGRGFFIRGDHTESPPTPPLKRKSVPLTPPLSLINRLSVQAFNTLYSHKQWRKSVTSVQQRDSFFYPLDGLRHWNRLYGPKGFLQYQCVLPSLVAESACEEMLGHISDNGGGSFLVVLKAFGDIAPEGILSFPRDGITLALDFPFEGKPTLDLLARLDAITRAAHGAVYPAKDARMRGEDFRFYYPDWQQLDALRDPAIGSGFWQRVTGDT
ncbi:FAD-binding oxidoreductase [Granulosicoccaceae sp. 1_MG-2023]|nr:FAD-binding oxidoreductase [Granulosicoccaceae sp. 1_MG-2023]